MQLSDRIGRRMKLQDLHVLMAVVQAGSMGKAARRLHTSQPAISRSIAELESAFGVRLLDRTPQGVAPTEYGRALLEGGVAVFDELRQTVKRIEFLATAAAGEVRIGSTPLLATTFICAVADQLSRRYPRVAFHLVTGYVESLYHELAERRLDLLVVRRFGPIADKRPDFEFLFEDASVVVAGAHSPWARRRKLDLADVAGEPWVLPPPGSQIASVAVEAFRAKGLELPHAAVITDSPHVRMTLLATGRFLTILPVSALRYPAARGELKALPVALPASRVPNGIVTLKNRTLGPAAHLFIEAARDAAKRWPGNGRGVSRTNP